MTTKSATDKARDVVDEARAGAKSVAATAARTGKGVRAKAERTADIARDTAAEMGADMADAVNRGANAAQAAFDQQTARLKSSARETLDAATQSGRDVFEAALAGIADVTATAREAIAGQMEGRAEAGKAMIAEQSQKIAGQLSEAARAMGKSASQSQILDSVATGMSDISQSLRNRSVQGVAADLRGFVRRNPGVAVAGAAVLGFAVARIALGRRRRHQPAEEAAQIADQAADPAADPAGNPEPRS